MHVAGFQRQEHALQPALGIEFFSNHETQYCIHTDQDTRKIYMVHQMGLISIISTAKINAV